MASTFHFCHYRNMAAHTYAQYGAVRKKITPKSNDAKIN